MTEIRLTSRAAADVAEAQAWYDEQRFGLGEEFVMALDAALVRLSAHPDIGRVVRGATRRVVFRRFPFCLYYKLVDDSVVVIGVLHGRRHPSTWHERSDG